MLAVEESEFTHGLSEETVMSVLGGGNSTFCGVIATQLSHPSENERVHGFERVNTFFRATDLRFHLETYAQNQRSWAGDAAIIANNPKHASELWEIRQSPPNTRVTQIRALELLKQFSRIPFPHGQARPGDDPTFRADLERVLSSMQREAQSIFDD